jgi:hypothetical protein
VNDPELSAEERDIIEAYRAARADTGVTVTLASAIEGTRELVREIARLQRDLELLEKYIERRIVRRHPGLFERRRPG